MSPSPSALGLCYRGEREGGERGGREGEERGGGEIEGEGGVIGQVDQMTEYAA